MDEILLTQYSRAAGCGCKIAPAVLQEILHSNTTWPADARLLVGNGTNDDAAAYSMGNGQVLIATTDFFAPIVDDAYSYGQVAAANAISDVYAMGGKPILALALLGWPIDKLSASLAQQVLEGARATCAEAGIPLAGGHTIDAAEPIFGLCVNGLCQEQHLKRNSTAQAGDLLFLTKPLGTGILATAQKKGLLSANHKEQLLAQLTQLNKVGEALGQLPGITAMTDVTGFGLAGHLTEMAVASGLSATLHYGRIPVMEGARGYLAQRIVPDATYRNWNAYGANISFAPGVDVMEAFSLLPDPQTNGGLLIAVRPEADQSVVAILKEYGLDAHTLPIGTMSAKGEKTINVQS